MLTHGKLKRKDDYRIKVVTTRSGDGYICTHIIVPKWKPSFKLFNMIHSDVSNPHQYCIMDREMFEAYCRPHL